MISNLGRLGRRADIQSTIADQGGLNTRPTLGISGRYSCVTPFGAVLGCLLLAGLALAQEPEEPQRIWSTAHVLPKHTSNQQSGYFSIVEGKNGRLYIGTAKYGENAYLVEFDTSTKKMSVVVDAQKEIGSTAKGFAAQSKIHTRNNTGASGKIYVGTKQGHPEKDEKRTDYPGGYPMVYDPATGKTRVYDIPIEHQGIISITPDESRGIAYISTASDGRPTDNSHFMILDLATGAYRDLGDLRHMFAYIVIDHAGRAYHPALGGEIARYDPATDKLAHLKQTMDGKPPTAESLLAQPNGHPISWEISPDRKTLYAVSMSANQLFAYDLTQDGDVLPGRSLGPLIAGADKTDCRAMCVGPDGGVWMGVGATVDGKKNILHLVSYHPGEAAPKLHGRLAIKNPEYTEFVDKDGKALPWHHGVAREEDGTLAPRYYVMGICKARNGHVYLTTLYPFTVHEIDARDRLQ